MENCNPKLSQYFDSNYAKLQEEIGLFIKGFPTIQLNGLGSINDLIAQLIRQNSMLAGRFREQLGQIKETYRRNEQRQQETRRKQLELTQLLTTREEEIESCRERLLQAEQQLSNRTSEVVRLAQQTSRLEENQVQVVELEACIRQLKLRMFSTFNELLEGRSAKNPDIFVEKFQHMSEQLQLILASFRSSKQMEEHRENVEQQSQQFCELILEKFKMDRQKLKNEKQRNKDLTATIDQLCAYVSEFGARCKQTANIFKIVPPDRAIVEKYCQGLEKELDNIDRNVRQMRDKQSDQTPSSNGKRTIDLRLAAEVKQDRGSFEDILKTLAATVNRMNTDGSCRNKQHLEQLDKYKAEVKHLNDKLSRVVQDYEAIQKDNDQTYRQQIATKEELLKYFEQNLIETKERLEQQQIKSDQLQEQLKELSNELSKRDQQIAELEQEKQKILEEVERAEKVIIHLQDEKNQKQEKLRDAEQMIDQKVTQLVEQLEQKDVDRKALITQHELDKAQLQRQAQSERRTQIELTQNLLALKQAIEKENEVLQNKNNKLAELQSVNSKLLTEIASMSKLIEWLEDKVRTQGLQLRGKEMHRIEQEKTIKGLLNDNRNNLASLKSIKQEIPQVASVRSALEQSDMKLARVEQQNHNLKGLLKMARQDVNDSRKKLSEFIEVEQQKELLRLKCEAYSNQLSDLHSNLQDRQKQLKELEQRSEKLASLEHSSDKRRLELLQLQADNNRLSIELKHARSLLRKVEQLQPLTL